MKQQVCTPALITRYAEHLALQERAQSTIQKYVRTVQRFAAWAEDASITRSLVLRYKEHLLQSGRAPLTINAALAALHGFFAFAGWQDLSVKYLKVQRRMFCDSSRNLRRKDYERLVRAAKKQGNARLALLMEMICGTGVRVSEVKYLTVEAARAGRADVRLKGKVRTILIPRTLAKKLLEFARAHRIAEGEIFITKTGNGMSRRQIWGEMKRVCETAKVDARKVFPHNLRHLFARTFYKATRDAVRLADVLGHSSIETTRIYLISTASAGAKQLEKLGLVAKNR